VLIVLSFWYVIYLQNSTFNFVLKMLWSISFDYKAASYYYCSYVFFVQIKCAFFLVCHIFSELYFQFCLNRCYGAGMWTLYRVFISCINVIEFKCDSIIIFHLDHHIVWCVAWCICVLTHTVKHDHVVTSIKQSPILKVTFHLSCQKISFELNFF
jgi:hypothetical protein